MSNRSKECRSFKPSSRFLLEMATPDEVQALKREVELLKQLLHQERARSGSGNGGGQDGDHSARSPFSSAASSPHRTQDSHYFSMVKPPLDEDYRREPSPRRPASALSSPSRGSSSKSLRWKDQAQQSSAQSSYQQFVPIDTKRGKWWLKERQILSRNVPSPNDNTIAMKVRETWLWSGRAVVVDKIVTCQRSREEEHKDDHSERYSQRGTQDLQDEATRYREELRSLSNRKPSSQQVSPFASPTLTAQSAFHDSKQLAKEFIQGKSTTAPSSSATEGLSEPMRTASQRMEAEMAKAAAAVTKQEGRTAQNEGSTRTPSDDHEMQTHPQS